MFNKQDYINNLRSLTEQRLLNEVGVHTMAGGGPMDMEPADLGGEDPYGEPYSPRPFPEEIPFDPRGKMHIHHGIAYWYYTVPGGGIIQVIDTNGDGIPDYFYYYPQGSGFGPGQRFPMGPGNIPAGYGSWEEWLFDNNPFYG